MGWRQCSGSERSITAGNPQANWLATDGIERDQRDDTTANADRIAPADERVNGDADAHRSTDRHTNADPNSDVDAHGHIICDAHVDARLDTRADA